MPWSPITTAEVLQEFTPAEQAALEAIQASTSVLAAILDRTIAATRGNVRAGNYLLDDDATAVPDQLRSEVIAITRWRWLISLPAADGLQTEARKSAYEEALRKLDKVAAQEFNIEPPTTEAAAGGNWNSERKVIGRTHPTPKPSNQYPAEDPGYANVDGPADA